MKNIIKTRKAADSAKWLEAARRAEKHIKDLESAVRVFKRNATSGEPWPRDKKL